MSEFKFEILEEERGAIHFSAKRDSRSVEIMANIERHKRGIVLRELQIEGDGPGTLGLKGIRDLMRDFCDVQGVKWLRLYGARRTTGANRGSIPNPFLIRIRKDGKADFSRLEAGA
jgi:hypothetical protein